MKVTYRKAALKALRKLPAATQTRIEKAIATYAESSEGDVKALQGRDGARLRVGNYRVIFVETEKEIEVFHIGHLKDVYR